MKTGSFLIRLLAGVPVVAGLCLMQGCATSGGSKTTETPPAFSNVPPEAVVSPILANTNKVKVEAIPVMEVKEKPVLKPVAPWTTPYTVKAGETATEIAEKYGKRWQDVLAVNPDLSLKSHLKTGQIIQLPNPVDLAHPKAVVHKKKAEKSEKGEKAEKTEKKPAPAEAKTAEAAAAPATGEASYTVAKGDTIATIAAKHHVKRTDLEKANKLTAKSKLKVGEKIIIPGKAEAAAAPAAETTPAATAPAAVAPAPDANAVPPPPMDGAGAAPAPSAAAPVAPAPAAGVTAAPAAAEPKTYTVKEGEDIYAVAIRWGVSAAELKTLNNLTSSDLTPGTVLKIPAVPAAPAP